MTVKVVHIFTLFFGGLVFCTLAQAQTPPVDTTLSWQYADSLQSFVLQEVVVTAREEKGKTATSVIGKDAIEHIQPSSIKDVLELLPGGRAADPYLASPQVANLRSAASVSGNYATSALGTAVIIDGRPVGNNANLQSSPTYSNLGSSYVNYGTDLRTITTEDIESVEVVRGIASVEYGDLTSGLMKITRKRGGNTLRARFKADLSSKLFYVGKDFQWKTVTLNVGANYLSSMQDPRNPRQTYKRVTGTVRLGKTWKKELEYALNASRTAECARHGKEKSGAIRTGNP